MPNATRQEIEDWMVSYLADLLGMDPEEVSVTTSFEVYGVDSTAAAGMSGDLSDWLGLELDAHMAFELPTIRAVVEHLAEQLGDQSAA